MRIKTIHITPAAVSLDVLLKTRMAAISEKGFAVTGYSTQDEDGLKFMESGFDFIGSRHLTRKFDILQDVLFFFECFRILRKEKPHIVNTYGPKPGLYGRIAARLAGVPIVVHTSWGFYFNEKSPFYKKAVFISIERLSALFCDYIFSVNKDDLSLMERYRFMDSARLGYLGNGTDIADEFNPERIDTATIVGAKARYGLKHDSIVVGMVGRLTENKGYREYFSAAASLRKKYPEVEFLIVGPHDFSKGDGITRAMISDLEGRGVIKYMGPKSHEDMPLIYSLMDVVVLPSYREGFPRSLVEAASMGKPLIASSIRGCREAVEHGVNGYLVPAADSIQLGKKIEELIVNPQLRQKMGVNSRKKALAEFDERKLVERITNAYKSLLSKKIL